MPVAVRYANRGKQTPKRAVAFVLLLCIVVVSLVSMLFIALHADHDRHEASDYCELCAGVTRIVNLFANRLMAIGRSLFTSLLLFSSAGVLYSGLFLFRSDSPIRQKIRMNN